MKKIILILGLVLMWISMVQAGERELKEKIAYLKEIPEIAWIEYDSNNVYVGFHKLPADYNQIITMAALRGNRAFGRGIHLYVLHSKATGCGWECAMCQVTARHGKIEKNTCR